MLKWKSHVSASLAVAESRTTTALTSFSKGLKSSFTNGAIIVDGTLPRSVYSLKSATIRAFSSAWLRSATNLPSLG